ASAAAIDCSAISSGVTGSASDIVGVWIAPVIAQVMMILSDRAFGMKLIPRPRWRAEARLQIQPHADPIRSREPRNVLIDDLTPKQDIGDRRVGHSRGQILSGRDDSPREIIDLRAAEVPPRTLARRRASA